MCLVPAGVSIRVDVRVAKATKAWNRSVVSALRGKSLCSSVHRCQGKQRPPRTLRKFMDGKEVKYPRVGPQYAATAPAEKEQSVVGGRSDAPTWFERACSALMFVLPLSEGIYRLAIIMIRFCKRHALEFLFWCHLQLRQVSLALSSRAATDYTREDVAALETLLQMSRRIHSWLSDWFEQLMSFSIPLRPGRSEAPVLNWASTTFSTPESLWHLAWLSGMSLLAAMAGFSGHKNESKSMNVDPNTGNGRVWFRKPEVVGVSYFCAILMRVSWAPLQGMSNLSLELYSLGATLLTIVTTITALAQIHKLLFSNLAKISRCLEGMVEQVTSVAQLHRSLLMLDWIMCLFSNQVLEMKCLRSLMLAIYWVTVTTLENEVSNGFQKPYCGSNR